MNKIKEAIKPQKIGKMWMGQDGMLYFEVIWTPTWLTYNECLSYCGQSMMQEFIKLKNDQDNYGQGRFEDTGQSTIGQRLSGQPMISHHFNQQPINIQQVPFKLPSQYINGSSSPVLVHPRVNLRSSPFEETSPNKNEIGVTSQSILQNTSSPDAYPLSKNKDKSVNSSVSSFKVSPSVDRVSKKQTAEDSPCKNDSKSVSKSTKEVKHGKTTKSRNGVANGRVDFNVGASPSKVIEEPGLDSSNCSYKQKITSKANEIENKTSRRSSENKTEQSLRPKRSSKPSKLYKDFITTEQNLAKACKENDIVLGCEEGSSETSQETDVTTENSESELDGCDTGMKTPQRCNKRVNLSLGGKLSGGEAKFGRFDDSPVREGVEISIKSPSRQNNAKKEQLMVDVDDSLPKKRPSRLRKLNYSSNEEVQQHIRSSNVKTNPKLTNVRGNKLPTNVRESTLPAKRPSKPRKSTDP